MGTVTHLEGCLAAAEKANASTATTKWDRAMQEL
jgi:hypothetical protein